MVFLMDNMLVKIKNLIELKNNLKNLENEIKNIEDEIKKEMITQNITEMVIDVFKIKYIDVISKRLDTTLLKNENKAIYDRYIKETTSKRFTITTI